MQSLKRNELRVLHAILSLQDATRIRIAEKAGLSMVRTSSLLKSLIATHYVVRGGSTKSATGRPSIIYHLNPELGYSLGISIKTNKIQVLAVNPMKEIVSEKEFPLLLSPASAAHTNEIVNATTSAIQKTLSYPPFDKKAIVSIGIALPGMVDTKHGLWLQGLQFSGISHINLSEHLQNETRIPVFVEDEARAVAYREKYYGLAQGTRDIVLLYLDRGIGTGIFNNNRIYRGYHGLSGEIGHITHANGKYRCTCNNIGCLETILSTEGILRIFRDRLQEGVQTVLQQYNEKDGDKLDLENVHRAADAGDRVAKTTLFEIAQFLGDAIVILVKLFNPQKILVSGRVAMFKDYFAEPVQSILKQRVHAEMIHDLSLHFCEYATNHEAHGAAILALLGRFGGSGSKVSRHPDEGF